MDTPTIPKKEGRDEIASVRAEVVIERQSDGSFMVQISVDGQPLSAPISGVTAVKEASGRVVLSLPGQDPRLVVGAPDASGARTLQAENLPLVARLVADDPLAVVSMKEVKAKAGSAEEKTEVADTAKTARKNLGEKNQQLSAAIGFQHGFQFDPLLTAGWQFTFSPLGKALQVPIAIQLDYVPPHSVLLGASAGLQTTIPSRVPVELHIFRLGVKGGVLAEGGEGIARADRELKRVIGPTFGTGVAVRLGSVSVGIDYEYLQNLVKKGPNVNTLTLGAAVHF
jgi:hypothetical protein